MPRRVFILHCSAHPRDLPSFPTRRSSDLFNNVLTAIAGYAELLREDLPGDDARRGDLEEILRATDRAATLTRQLLAFSRDRKSTRLNSSHTVISYAVFCLKKKNIGRLTER